MFTQNKKEFLRRYITMEATWIHHFTLESKRESADLYADKESHPKTQRKVMATLFWDLEINSDNYIGFFDCLKAEITQKRPHLKKKKVLFHQDNAPCHKPIKTAAKLVKWDFELLLHPPYSPDLPPPPATTGSLQNSKRCSVERDMSQTKK
uniref:Histonelysine Nmethyltransferase SETMARlike [Hydra vulgaris] n=1 Tax=Lepeophtheirus salmonis TaxID=72036 RepID=A0A0K2UV46_LEPSM